MDTILERQRSAHEERERLIEAQVKELLHKKSTQREQINSDHRVRGLLDRYIEVRIIQPYILDLVGFVRRLNE